jgi:peptidoglycan/xylan/chitin deacetylase (PgdA/CDA1 family)
MKGLQAFLAILLFSNIALAREIAITFDDAPMGKSPAMSSVERSRAIISALQSRDVQGAVIFANSGKLKDGNTHILAEYAQANFIIANHSHSHRSASKIGPQEYLKDAKNAHDILSDYDNYRRWHRFPYLNYGANESERAYIQQGLSELGYIDGYVTVDNFDWALNHRYRQSLKKGENVDYEALKELYLEILIQAVDYYDELMLKTVEKPGPHILLLHENDLAALYIGDLVDALRAQNWKIVSADVAYTGSFAKMKVAPKFLGQSKIVALAAQQGADAKVLRHERENVEVLNALYEQRVIK